MKAKIVHLPKKGRGLVSVRKIMKGELIEKCELIFLNNQEISKSIESYVYEYNKKLVAIALGNGSLINHSDEPNCEFYFNYELKLLVIKAIKNISPREELTINYGYSNELKKKFKLIK